MLTVIVRPSLGAGTAGVDAADVGGTVAAGDTLVGDVAGGAGVADGDVVAMDGTEIGADGNGGSVAPQPKANSNMTTIVRMGVTMLRYS